MLLWESLKSRPEGAEAKAPSGMEVARSVQRLTYDKRCAAITKSGRRCRARVRKGQDFCPFHDPSVTPEHRRVNAAKGGRNHHRLSRLPDGYLRNLSSRAAVVEAMDRLYREVRLGIVDHEMGRVLFDILTRILDTQLNESDQKNKSLGQQTKVELSKLKLSEALTKAERARWREAIKNAERRKGTRAQQQITHQRKSEPDDQPAQLILTNAS